MLLPSPIGDFMFSLAFLLLVLSGFILAIIAELLCYKECKEERLERNQDDIDLLREYVFELRNEINEALQKVGVSIANEEKENNEVEYGCISYCETGSEEQLKSK